MMPIWAPTHNASNADLASVLGSVCVAAQRQKVQHFGPYIPKQMTEEELAIQAVSYSSQGAR